LLFTLLLPLGANAAQSFLTLYINIMNYGTIIMLQNQSGVLTVYEIPSSFSSVPRFEAVQTTGKPLQAVVNVTLRSGEVALIHEYGVSGFSPENFLYQQVNVPGIATYSNSTTAYSSPTTIYVRPNYGYQIQFTPWFGIQNQPVNSVESTGWKVLPYWQNGQLVINSTGASAGGYAVTVTVTNSQSIPTPAPFDQFLNITQSQIASALGSTVASQLWQQAMSNQFLNLLFTQNGQPLYAWIQNYTSSWVAVWVKLPNGVPANGAVNITMVFTTSNQYPYTGLAPYLTSTYGQYDNGQFVFPVYYNFAGTSLPQGLVFTVLSNPSGASGSYKVSNSLNITNINGQDFWYNYFMISLVYINKTFNFATTPLIFETILKTTGSAPSVYAKAGLVYMNSITASSTTNGEVSMHIMPAYGYQVFWQSGNSYIAPSVEQHGGSMSLPTVLALFLNGSYVTGFYGSSLNNLVKLASAVTPSGYTGTGYIGLWVTAHTSSGTFWAVFQLLLARPWPPNGVMPTVTGVSKQMVFSSQYLAWAYKPVGNVINVTLSVTSYPVNTNNTAGVVLYSPNIGNLQSDSSGSFYGLLISFNGSVLYYAPGSSYKSLKSSAFPTPKAPFTMTVLLTQSSGNVTVSAVYINGTAYTVNVNTLFPWSQIGYVGIRADANNLFYVSYFAVSPAPYGGAEQFLNNAESTAWKVLPYWKGGQLVVNTTGASAGGQYIAWKYTLISNVINVTIRVPSYPSKSMYAGIAFYSSNLQNSPYFMVAFYTGAVYYFTSTGSTQLATFTTPSPPFTMSVILVKNSAGNVTVQSVIINGSTTYSLNTNVPFPWSQIAYIGIRADPGNLFYISYFGLSPFQYGAVKYTINSVSLPSMPYTSSVTVLISRLSNGSYAVLGVYNGTWKELNIPFTNPNGKFTVTFNPLGPVNITVTSSNVLSYGALFSRGNGVLLEAQNAIPPSSPTTYEPLAYIGSNGQVGGGASYYTPQFTPITLNSMNYYQGATIATTNWGTTNFTYYAVSLGQRPPPPQNYVVVGTGFTTNWANAPSGYYSFQSGFIDMVYIANNSVATSQTPPSVSSLLFFFDPTYITQQGQYVNPFTNQTYQLVGSLTRQVDYIGVIKFLKPNVTNPVIYIPPFTEVIVRNSTGSQAFVNYYTFPYKTVTLPPGNYQFTIILIFTAYSFVLIGWQGWNVTVYQNGAPMIINDPITEQIQPFNTQGLLSAQVVADPNRKVLTIYLQPISTGVGSYSPKMITFPKPAPQLVLPLTESTPFSLSTLTVSGIVTVAMVLAIVIALARANQDLLGSIAAGGAIVAVVGIIIHIMPIVFIGSVLVIIATAYRFARRNSQ